MRKQNRNNRICTNEESGKTDFIIDPLLPIGKENAITTQELMRIQSNSGLASKLFITLTEGCGYDKICTFASVPARKTDYQAYLRKALKILNDMLLLKNMPADFPAEKI